MAASLIGINRPEVARVARLFAIDGHGAQMYGNQPYVVHLDEVYDIACEFAAPIEVKVAAYLHDMLEDTNTTKAGIVEVFGTTVARLVQAVTNWPGKNRRERHAATYPQIRSSGGPDAVLLKLCDRIANVRASVREFSVTGVYGLLRMYAKEHAVFQKALYLPGEHEPAWAALNSLLGDHNGSPSEDKTVSSSLQHYKVKVLDAAIAVLCEHCARGIERTEDGVQHLDEGKWAFCSARKLHAAREAILGASVEPDIDDTGARPDWGKR